MTQKDKEHIDELLTMLLISIDQPEETFQQAYDKSKGECLVNQVNNIRSVIS